MTSFRHHMERHRTDRVGWLRANVLGANDGIVSTASLLMGVAAASVSHSGLLMTGVANPVAEAKELTAIYVDRGLDPGLAKRVADQPMKHDAPGAHARDEPGISQALSAQPVQAALASAASMWRVMLRGALAMAMTASVGALFGTVA